MTREWQEVVIKNFDLAADFYNQNAKLQLAIAWRLAKLCSIHQVPNGLWVDLGAGTGLLADALELLNSNQKVLRVDSSPEMLNQQKSDSPSQQWDLNIGIPPFNEFPTLVASSFTLHWLENPVERLNEWFQAITPGGWLALAVPVEGSFPQWHKAAKLAEVECTALSFPSSHSLLSNIPKKCIKYHRLHNFTESAKEVSSLFTAIRKVGAQASKKPPMRIRDWRILYKSWDRSLENKVSLTWRIQLVLIKR